MFQHLIFKKKKINTYLKLEICVVCREFQPLDMYLCFFETKLDDYLVFFIRNLETRVQTGFSVYTIYMYLCGQVEITKWVLCSRKICVNERAYFRFFMCKIFIFKIKSKVFKFSNTYNFDKCDVYFQVPFSQL